VGPSCPPSNFFNAAEPSKLQVYVTNRQFSIGRKEDKVMINRTGFPFCNNTIGLFQPEPLILSGVAQTV
jgi:hypothetical protein